MTRFDGPGVSRLPSRRLTADDAYTAWFNAHSHGTHTLRAWNTAAKEDRAAAYRDYVADLALEEEAARALEELHRRATAA
jgi:hypothetical protein